MYAGAEINKERTLGRHGRGREPKGVVEKKPGEKQRAIRRQQERELLGSRNEKMRITHGQAGVAQKGRMQESGGRQRS